ncbi:hypothetical protein C0585_04850 [Candidatus Woesearchaeota archaeon]|nr:MAG: hypothetical protein C0585_04850 [Candidatus Woesearchaeota archaeon]
MAFDIRKIFVILAVAILFTLFSFALFEAFYPNIEWNDYCEDKFYQSINGSGECEAYGGKWTNYDVRVPVEKQSIENGYCDINYYCNEDYDEARDQRYYYGFIFLSILGAIAIVLGINLPLTNPINEWIGTGFMLGGLFNIFLGTAMYYQDLSRYMKPIVLFLELALVIFLTYKKLGEEKERKKKKKKFFFF